MSLDVLLKMTRIWKKKKVRLRDSVRQAQLYYGFFF